MLERKCYVVMVVQLCMIINKPHKIKGIIGQKRDKAGEFAYNIYMECGVFYFATKLK